MMIIKMIRPNDSYKKCRDNDTPIPDDIELQNLNDN